MGQVRHPGKVNLIIGLLTGETALFDKAGSSLKRAFGPVDLESAILDFAHTNYYSEEMGENLKRKFLSFEKTLRLDSIYKVKLFTNALERRFSKEGKRAINIDPGYLDLSKIILFSTKDYSHRIYLNKGVFAEGTLFYKDKKFNPWPWTYPDYKTGAYGEFFESVREIYRNKIRGKGLR